MMKRMILGSICSLALTIAATEANAASHLWRFNEVFSNADGSIMFIEMKECCGANSELALDGKWVLSTSTTNQFFFPADLPCCTANKHLLLATQGFADLPGAPTPDYIISEGFFDISGDLLEYWLYDAADWTFGQPVPTDGINSLHRDAVNGDFIAVNSPTNFNDESGSIDLTCTGDFDGSGDVAINDLLNLLAAWGPCAGCPEDIDGDGIVAINDLLDLLAAWGPCP